MMRLAIWLAILTWPWPTALAADGLPFAVDLQTDGQLARARQGVVLVMFTQPNCVYCKTVHDDFLVPLSRNADMQARLVMRRVDRSAFTTLHDFAGKPLAQRQFADANGVKLVPTVMLFSADGQLLANPLVGISSADYYGFYLDQAIEQALAKVRAATPLSQALTAP